MCTKFDASLKILQLMFQDVLSAEPLKVDIEIMYIIKKNQKTTCMPFGKSLTMNQITQLKK